MDFSAYGNWEHRACIILNRITLVMKLNVKRKNENCEGYVQLHV